MKLSIKILLVPILLGLLFSATGCCWLMRDEGGRGDRRGGMRGDDHHGDRDRGGRDHDGGRD